MHKKIISILVAFLLIIPLGSVFADDDALATQPPASVTATPTPDVSPTATPSPTPTTPSPTPTVSPTPTPSPTPQGEVERYIVQFAEPVRSLTASDNISDTIPDKEQIGPADKNMYLVELDESTYQALANDSHVLSIQPDGKSYIQDVPNDQYYSQQWNLDKVDMPDAWDIEKGNSDVVVAVIDTGAGNHPDLTSAIVSPYDAVNKNEAFPNYAHDGNSPAWHGTFVAGIIAAQTDNSLGVAGMAPGVSIMPINAFEWDEEEDDYIAWDSTIINAIDYAVNHGADVINMSLGGSDSDPLLLQAISDARAAGITVIAAAGNGGNDIPMYPASYDGVISVSATDQNDQKAPFSSYGGYVDLSAPGVGIRGLGLSGYLTGQGTSFSAPMVSALAALIKSHDASLSPDQVESIMKDSAVDLGDAGFDYYYGEGRINAYAALASMDNKLSVTLIADVPSPQTALSTIRLTADMENGGDYEYYFEYKRDGGDWTLLRDWETAETFSWVPDLYGEYTLRVSVRPIGGDLDSRATLFFTVNAPAWGNPADTAIDIDAGETAGELSAMGEQDMYRFTAPEDGTYTIGTTGETDTFGALFDSNGSLITENDNDADANFAIEAEMTQGSVYYIGVRHAGSGTGAYTLSVERSLLPITGVKLTADPEASCEYNSPVYLSAEITGGSTKDAQYQFQAKKDGADWEIIQDFSEVHDCTWTPPAIGTYEFRVYARNSVQEEDVSDTITSYVGTDIPRQTGVELSVEAELTEYNQPITLVATPKGDDSLIERAEYRYLYKYGNTWDEVQDEWGDNTTCEWTPPKKGTYTFRVYMRTEGRTDRYDTYDDIKYVASDIPKQTGVTLTPDKAPVQEAGTDILLSAQSSKSNAALASRAEYLFKYKFGKTWTTLYDDVGNEWSQSATREWTPTAKGTYTLRVYARTEGRSGYDVYNTYAYDVDVEPLKSVSLTVGKSSPQEAATEIELTADAEGLHADGTELYLFQAKLGRSWYTIHSWSTENKVTWEPSKPGDYTLQVQVRAAGRSGCDASYTETEPYTITEIPKQDGVSLTSDVKEDQEYGTDVTLTATPTEGVASDRAEYIFRYKYGSKWYYIGDWTDSNICTWQPPKKGKYAVRVYTRTKGRTNSYDAYATLTCSFADIPKQTGVNLTFDKEPVQESNTDILLTAENTTENETLASRARYKFVYKLGRETEVIQDWSEENTCTWTPVTKGKYILYAYVRTEGRSDYDAYTYYKYYEVDVTPLAKVNLAAEQPSPQKAGTEVALTATAEGLHADNAEYRFLYKYGSKWYVIQDWTGSNTCTWTLPSREYMYTVQVQARAVGRSDVDQTATIENYFAYLGKLPVAGLDVTVSPDTPQEYNASIDINAQATGASADMTEEYQLRVKLGSKWYTLSPWSTAKDFTWQPSKTGAYTIEVQTRAAGRSGYDAIFTEAYTITDIPKQTGVNLTFDKEPVQESNTDILLTAENTTENETLAGRAQYKFVYKLGRETEVIRDWSEENTCTWTPVTKGKYILYTYVRTEGRSDYDAYTYYKYYEVDVTPLAKVNLTAEQPSPQKAGTEVTLTATAEGLHADNAEYRFLYKYGSKWYVIQDWTGSNTCTWTLPSREYIYAVQVQARAVGRSDVDQTATIENYFAYLGKLPVEGLDVTIPDECASPQEYNTPIDIHAQAAGASADMTEEYQLRVKLGSKWYTLSPWSTAKDFTWLPSQPGTYTIEVQSRAAGRDGYDAIYTETYVAEDIPQQQGISLAVQADSSEFNTPVKLIATPEGDSSLVERAEYRYLYKYDNKWAEVQDEWAGNTTCEWTPPQNGTYTFRVYMRTKGRTDRYDVYDDIEYTVTNIIDMTPGVTLVGSPSSPVAPETKVTFTAIAGGIYADGAEYRFTFYNGDRWYTARDWSTSNTFTERPSNNCTYKYKVEARIPGNSDIVSCTINYRVGATSYTYSVNTMAMLQDQYGGAVKSSGGRWVDASQSDILYYVNPNNWMDGKYKYQFLSLNYISGIKVSDLNAILCDNSQNGGVLKDKGSVFLSAAQQYNINPAYLVSHAMLETGNGDSDLARGIVVNGKKVYNIYGIQAYDSNPNYYGSQYAYEQGWTTVDKAITGGAEWISKYYINRSSGEQNTLYSMRWNPNDIQKQIDSGDSTPTPTHQYATDIAWAVKQVDRLKSLMDRCVGAVLEFIIPSYK